MPRHGKMQANSRTSAREFGVHLEHEKFNEDVDEMGQSSLEICRHLTGGLTLRYGHRRIPLPLQTFLREVKQMPIRLATSFSGSPKYCCSSSNPILLCAGISSSQLRQTSTRSRRLNPPRQLSLLLSLCPCKLTTAHSRFTNVCVRWLKK